MNIHNTTIIDLEINHMMKLLPQINKKQQILHLLTFKTPTKMI